jgi:hypothetical protein
MDTSPQAPTPDASTLTSDRAKLIADQLGRLIDLYKHHFDLFLKGVAGYLAIIGFIAGAITKAPSRSNRIALFGLISVVSLFAFVGSVISWNWVRVMRDGMHDLCKTLDLVEPTLSPAERIVILMIFFCVTLFLGGIGYAIKLSIACG